MGLFFLLIHHFENVNGPEIPSVFSSGLNSKVGG